MLSTAWILIIIGGAIMAISFIALIIVLMSDNRRRRRSQKNRHNGHYWIDSGMDRSFRRQGVAIIAFAIGAIVMLVGIVFGGVDIFSTIFSLPKQK